MISLEEFDSFMAQSSQPQPTYSPGAGAMTLQEFDSAMQAPMSETGQTIATGMNTFLQQQQQQEAERLERAALQPQRDARLQQQNAEAQAMEERESHLPHYRRTGPSDFTMAWARGNPVNYEQEGIGRREDRFLSSYRERFPNATYDEAREAFNRVGRISDFYRQARGIVQAGTTSGLDTALRDVTGPERETFRQVLQEVSQREAPSRGFGEQLAVSAGAGAHAVGRAARSFVGQFEGAASQRQRHDFSNEAAGIVSGGEAQRFRQDNPDSEFSNQWFGRRENDRDSDNLAWRGIRWVGRHALDPGRAAQEGAITTAGMVPRIAPGVAATLLHPAAGFAYFYGLTQPEMARDLRERGMSEESSNTLSAGMAVPHALIEVLQGRGFIRPLAATGLRARVGAFGRRFMAEMGEEAGQEAIELFTRRTAQAIDSNVRVDWQREFGQSLENIMNAGLAMPFMMGPGALRADPRSQWLAQQQQVANRNLQGIQRARLRGERLQEGTTPAWGAGTDVDSGQPNMVRQGQRQGLGAGLPSQGEVITSAVGGQPDATRGHEATGERTGHPGLGRTTAESPTWLGESPSQSPEFEVGSVDSRLAGFEAINRGMQEDSGHAMQGLGPDTGATVHDMQLPVATRAAMLANQMHADAQRTGGMTPMDRQTEQALRVVAGDLAQVTPAQRQLVRDQLADQGLDEQVRPILEEGMRQMQGQSGPSPTARLPGPMEPGMLAGQVQAGARARAKARGEKMPLPQAAEPAAPPVAPTPPVSPSPAAPAATPQQPVAAATPPVAAPTAPPPVAPAAQVPPGAASTPPGKPTAASAADGSANLPTMVHRWFKDGDGWAFDKSGAGDVAAVVAAVNDAMGPGVTDLSGVRPMADGRWVVFARWPDLHSEDTKAQKRHPFNLAATIVNGAKPTAEQAAAIIGKLKTSPLPTTRGEQSLAAPAKPSAPKPTAAEVAAVAKARMRGGWKPAAQEQAETEAAPIIDEATHKANVRKVHDLADRQLTANEQLTPGHREHYQAELARVINAMPRSAVKHLAENVRGFEFYSDVKALSTAMAKISSEAAERVKAGRNLAGAFASSTGVLHLDGAGFFDVGGEQAYLTGAWFAHEFAHAVDHMPKKGGNRRWRFSSQPKWKVAFHADIAPNGKGSTKTGSYPLSEYATTNEVEGFAEFARLAWGQDTAIEALRAKYPRATKFFEENGLLSNAGTRQDTSMPEVGKESIITPKVVADVAKQPAGKPAEPSKPPVPPAQSPAEGETGERRGVTRQPATDAKKAGRFPSHEEVIQEEWHSKRSKAAEVHREAGLTDEQIAAFRQREGGTEPKARLDAVTGLLDSKGSESGRKEDTPRYQTMQRAIEQADATGQTATYTEMDLRNLGALNAKYGQSGADRPFRAIADIIREELTRAMPDSQVFRHGGDEMSAVTVGYSKAVVDAALQKASDKIDDYLRSEGIKDLPHTKRDKNDNLKEPGTGIYYSTTEATRGENPADAFARADKQLEANKLEITRVYRTAGKTGAVTPGGRPGGVETGTGEADQTGQREGGQVETGKAPAEPTGAQPGAGTVRPGEHGGKSTAEPGGRSGTGGDAGKAPEVQEEASRKQVRETEDFVKSELEGLNETDAKDWLETWEKKTRDSKNPDDKLVHAAIVTQLQERYGPDHDAKPSPQEQEAIGRAGETIAKEIVDLVEGSDLAPHWKFIIINLGRGDSAGKVKQKLTANGFKDMTRQGILDANKNGLWKLAEKVRKHPKEFDRLVAYLEQWREGSLRSQNAARDVGRERQGRIGGGGRRLHGGKRSSDRELVGSPTIPVSSGKPGVPIDRHAIIRDAAKKFGFSFRVGRVLGKASGIYKRFVKTVRLVGRKAGDLAIFAHETAHFLSDAYEKTDSITAGLSAAARSELLKLDYDPKRMASVIDLRAKAAAVKAFTHRTAAQNARIAKWEAQAQEIEDLALEEGWAEYIRHRETLGDHAAVAPEFDKHFEGWLKKHKDVGEKLDWYRDRVDDWKTADPADRLNLSKTGKVAQTWKQWYTDLKAGFGNQMNDRFRGFRWMVEASNKITGPKTFTEDAYRLARVFAGKAGANAANAIQSGIYDINNKKLADGVTETLAKYGKEELDELSQYLIVAQSLERYKIMEALEAKAKAGTLTPEEQAKFDAGDEPGMPRSDAQELFDRWESKYEADAEVLRKFWHGLIHMMTAAGWKSPAEGHRITSSYRYYSPMMRVIEDLVQAGGFKGMVRFKTMKGRTGGDQQIIDPLAMLPIMAEQAFDVAHKTMVARALKNMGESTPGFGEFMEEVPGKESYTDGTVEIDGKTFQVKPEMWSILKQMDPHVFHPIIEATAGAATKAVRLGSVQLRPSFLGFINPIKDIPTGMLRTEGRGKDRWKGRANWMESAAAFADEVFGDMGIFGLRTLGNFFRNAKDLIAVSVPSLGLKRDVYMELYERWGVGMGAFIGQDVGNSYNALRDFVSEVADKGQPTKLRAKVIFNPIQYAKAAFNMAQALGARMEANPRIAEGQLVLERHGITRKMLEAGHEVPADIALETRLAEQGATQDFLRGGSFMMGVNRVSAFTNAQYQGVSQFWEALRERPAVITARGVALLTIPSLLLWAFLKDDDRWKELPDWLKFNFWNVFDGNRTWSVPIPHDFGTVFAALPMAMADSAYRRNPDAMKRWLTEVFPALDNPARIARYLPDILKTPMELITNYSFFRGRPIVGQDRQRLEPYQQHYDYNTSASRYLGWLMTSESAWDPAARRGGMSPAMIDHLISGTTGGLGTDILRMADEGPSRALGYGRLNRDISRGETVNTFYERRREVTQAYNTAGGRDRAPAELVRQHQRFEAIADLAQDLTAANRSTAPRYITGLTRYAMGESNSTHYPNPLTATDLPPEMARARDLWLGNVVQQATAPQPQMARGETYAHHQQELRTWRTNVAQARSTLTDLGLPRARQQELLRVRAADQARRSGTNANLATRAPAFVARLQRVGN